MRTSRLKMGQELECVTDEDLVVDLALERTYVGFVALDAVYLHPVAASSWMPGKVSVLAS
jgi:hypothetical protein